MVAVVASMAFPSTLVLKDASTGMAAPGGISEVLLQLLKNMVDNPVNALLHANYIGILVWAVGMGIALRQGAEHTRQVMADFSHGITLIIQAVIRLAPVGIFGLVASTIATNGTQVLAGYAHLLLVLIGCMLFIALVVNPAIVWWKLRRNPYPLVLMCLRESGVTAFFTRSSAANIPVNLAIAQRLNLDPTTSGVAIPLGATINMAGAAITISVLTLAAVNTMGMVVDVPTAILLCVVSARFALAAPRGCPAARCCSSLWPARCLAFPMMWPCKWWPWASSLACCKIRQKRRSTLRPTSSLPLRLAWPTSSAKPNHRCCPAWRRARGCLQGRVRIRSLSKYYFLPV